MSLKPTRSAAEIGSGPLIRSDVLKRIISVLVLVLTLATSGALAAQRAVAVISIDGMHPNYVLKADEYRLRVPNLRRFLRDGVHASAVRGVSPTVTYPSHTTMLTGVWPVKHGIYANETWDPLRKNQGGWYWYAEDIQAPTLWQAAARVGYTVGSISWPVSVGAPGIAYNIPEYWRAQTSDDLKLQRAISTPGLLQELQRTAGEYTLNLDAAEAGDWDRTRYAVVLIRQKGVRFLTLHLAALDHVEHSNGPYSARALQALEEIDGMVGQVEAAMREIDPRAAICVVSDHGFGAAGHRLNLDVAFVQAGLISLSSKAGAPAITDWKAMPWIHSGSAAIILKNPEDGATSTKVEELLRRLAADPNNGIDRVLDGKAIADLGGAPNAAFWVDMKTNFLIGSALAGPLVEPIALHGAHGYAPTHPELSASFLLAAPDVRHGDNLGMIDMRSIAPTVANLLGIPFPSADLKALPVLRNAAKP
jgi:predicted AlkP superfamily pyrophosphatase or phosphodiesterase